MAGDFSSVFVNYSRKAKKISRAGNFKIKVNYKIMKPLGAQLPINGNRNHETGNFLFIKSRAA